MMEVKKVGTHDEYFHGDCVTSWVIIKEIWSNAELVRTRDKEILKTCDLIFDVGGENAKFDHHKTVREQRENGIYYSSVGLLWKEFGHIIVKKYAPEFTKEEIIEATNRFDKNFLMAICGIDNGQSMYSSEYKIKTYSDIIEDFCPLWDEQGIDLTEAYFEAVDLATKIFKKELKKTISYFAVKNILIKALKERKSIETLILDKYMPWQGLVNELDDDLLYVIYPTESGTFMIQTVTKEIGSFENRKDLPAEWSGKRDNDLEEITGVKGSVFCHANLFLAGTNTLEGTIRLAELAVEYVPAVEKLIKKSNEIKK